MSVFRTSFVLLMFSGLLAACGSSSNNSGTNAAATGLALTQIGRFESNVFDESAAEIVAHDPASQRLFVVNADAGQIDVLSMTDPTSPARVGSIDAANQFAASGGINSVAVAGGIVAIAVENDDGTQAGVAQFYNAADLAFRGQVATGVLPDAITFTPDGLTALVANEGEPASDYSVDPEGSVTIINISNPDAPIATQVGFADFNVGGPRAAELPAAVRIFGNFGRTERSVTNFTDTDPATLTLNSVAGIAVNDFFTLASDEGDPIAYRVASISGNTLTLTDDFDGDSEVADAGASGLTAYLHDGLSSVAQDLEPEYIAVSADGTTAFVSLQENNAVAELNIANARVTRIFALGTKDHSVAGNELDASNDDDAINIQNWPVMGLYQPDTIATYSTGGVRYFVTANEGDAREYDAFVEEVNIDDVGIDSDSFANAGDLEADEALGSLKTSIALINNNDTDGDGALDILQAYGARSFSIWNAADGSQVFDSGSDFANIVSNLFPGNFNSDNDENSFDSRSDNKGVEPEALAIAQFNDRSYAFIGLERMGGIMVYDVTNPANARFVTYENNRDYDFNIEDDIDDGTAAAGAAGDLGPESIIFISAANSPTDEALLVVGNEVSGTTTIYQVAAQ